MKNIILTVFILALACSYADADNGPEINDVCFNKSIESYILNDYNANNNGTFNPSLQIITSSNSEIESNCIRIISGRSDNTTTKEWVESGLKSEGIAWKSGNMTASYKPHDDTPDELNFAVNVNLTFFNGVTCNNIYIGQGSTNTIVTRYNWWLFANNNFQDHTITCDKSNEAFVLKVKSENINTFDLN